MNNNGFCIGMPIRFTRAYSSNPKKRLRGNSGKEAVPLYDLNTDDVTPVDVGHGVVVGQRNYIMSNWLRDHDSEVGYWIDGKKRAMLLVSVGFTRSFVLVKPEDAEPAPEAIYRSQMRELMQKLQQISRDKSDIEFNYNALHEDWSKLCEETIRQEKAIESLCDVLFECAYSSVEDDLEMECDGVHDWDHSLIFLDVRRREFYAVCAHCDAIARVSNVGGVSIECQFDWDDECKLSKRVKYRDVDCLNRLLWTDDAVDRFKSVVGWED